MTLTAEQILKAEDVTDLVKVDVPEWGGELYVRVMDGASRDRWELSTSKALESPNTANVRASLVAATACDEKGKLLFAAGQVAALGAKSSVPLDRVYDIAKTINKLNDEDVEELEKN